MGNKLQSIAQHLAEKGHGNQVIFVCGKNTRLARQLRKITFHDPVWIYGFSDKIPELLAASDVFITKAGWVSLYEGLIAQRPMIISDVVPGQEEPNSAYIKDVGAGEIIKNPAAAAQRCLELLAKPKLCANFRTKIEKLNLPTNGADLIVNAIYTSFL